MTKNITAKAEKICEILIQNYGNTVSERKLPPIDELVMTILSQHTNDKNMFRAFESLKRSYSTWDDVLHAPQDELAHVIRSSGMFNLKAKRIQATLSEIKNRVGKIDLSHLETMETEAAKEWLTTLYGVGPKTAAIVLLFSFGRSVLPVDTHVWRVTKRLGLIDNNVSREKAHIILGQVVPSRFIPSLNRNLVYHGRTICRAQSPICEDCFLNHLCEFWKHMRSK